MRRFIVCSALALYAFILSLLHAFSGVHTDEAKYLLSIPYPHPPLVRFFLGLSSGMPLHSFFWRFLFANLCVQSVWLVWSLCADLPPLPRRILTLFWLGSSAMLLQAGTIMMAPLTALYASLFVYVALRHHGLLLERRSVLLTGAGTFGIAILWLASLFTAYQGVLYAPIVVRCFLSSPVLRRQWFVYLLFPLFLLVLYTLSNPLILASFVLAAQKDHSLTVFARLMQFGILYASAGSGLFSILGTIGIVVGRRREIMYALLLVSTYVFFSFQPYYAVLFLPLFLVGCYDLLHMLTLRQQYIVWYLGWIFILFFAYCSILSLRQDRVTTLDARRNLEQSVPSLFEQPLHRRLLIVGAFGHEWQYYFPFDIRSYTHSLVDRTADIVACLDACPASLTKGMFLAVSTPFPMYVSRSFSFPSS